MLPVYLVVVKKKVDSNSNLKIKEVVRIRRLTGTKQAVMGSSKIVTGTRKVVTGTRQAVTGPKQAVLGLSQGRDQGK